MPRVFDALLSGDSFLAAFPGAGVGAGALAADRQILAMPDAAEALNVPKAADVFGRLPAKLTFDSVFVIEEGVDPLNFVVGQLTSPTIGRQVQRAADFHRDDRADAMKVLQRDNGRLVVRNVDTEDAWHQKPFTVFS
jgi:hypothetical protein